MPAPNAATPETGDPAATGRSVLVGVDGSAASVHAAVYAGDMARRRGLPLTVVHVTPWHAGDTALPITSAEVREQFRNDATALVDAAVTAVREETGLAAVTGAVVDDHPVDGLLALSASAELMVVGATGVGGLPGLLLGSTAGAVVQHSRCPVITLPGPEDPAPPVDGPVVAGVDDRSGAGEVLELAFAEAAARGAELVALHAWRDVAVDAALGRFGALVDWATVADDQQRRLSETVAPWRERYPGVPVREELVRERPVPALREAGAGAALLVVAHRSRGIFSRLGSTTHGLLHRVPCPVAVVPLPREG